MELKEFIYDSSSEIEAEIKGKIIGGIIMQDIGIDNWLILKFTDRTELHIRYDWLYEWGIKNHLKEKEN